MDNEEFRAIRAKLKLDRNEMAELLGLSGYNYVSNIELGLRNPSKLTIKFLRYLDSMTLSKAQKIIEEINKFQP